MLDKKRVYLFKITKPLVGFFRPTYPLLVFLLRLLLYIKFKNQYKIFIRNSVYLGYFQPILSDIDLGIYTDQNWSPKEIKMIQLWYQIVKKYIPVVGEIEIVDQDIYTTLSFYFNPYEKLRSPLFKAEARQAVQNKASRLVYISKFVINNYPDLASFPDLVASKTQFHLRQIGIEQLSKRYISLEELQMLLIEEFGASWIKALFNFCQQWTRPQIPLHEWIVNAPNILETWCLFYNYLCFSNLPECGRLTNFHIEVLKENILWECCSLTMQTNSYENPDVINHLNRMKTFLPPSDIKQLQEASTLIEWAIKKLSSK